MDGRNQTLHGKGRPPKPETKEKIQKKERGKATTGRPAFDIDWDELDRWLEAWCDGTVIAEQFGIHEDTLYIAVREKYGVTFSEYKQKKRLSGNDKLRRVQHDQALDGDNAMLIWLGKNRLDQTDKKQVTQDINLGSSFGDLLS
jgi:hypothetical protein